MGSSGSYQITNSVRLAASRNCYFSRTFGTATNQNIFTWSGWAKLSGQDTTDYGELFVCRSASSDAGFGVLQVYNGNLRFTGWTTVWRTTTQELRDPSGWYHIILSVDTTQTTAANRIKIYINGSEVTAFSTNNNPTQSTTVGINTNTSASRLGSDDPAASARKLDGYLSEVYFIDGQQLTPSSFGETNSDGVWVPKAYTGTYGTNGFHLDFKDAALTAGSNAGLGKDVSGNGNYWTTNNISVTAGVTYDSMVDTPTNNYATLNPLLYNRTYAATLSEANLTYARGGAGQTLYGSTVSVSSGKWYFECYVNNSTSFRVGFCQTDDYANWGSVEKNVGTGAKGYGYSSSGNKTNNGSDVAYGDTYAATNLISCALDIDNGKIWWAKNGTWQASGDPAAGTNAAYTSISGLLTPAISAESNGGGSLNFGQRPFTYTPPTGFKALCTANLPQVAIAKPASYFNAKTRTGTGAAFNVTGQAFQPDLVWTKGRSGATDHALYDIVRGVQKQLESNNQDAETTETQGLTAFNSDGFSGGTLAQINTNAATYIDWMWNAGGTGVSNTAGSITSTVSANTIAGFSIVTYTGTGANATVGHGLGVAPKMVIVKQRGAGTNAWYVYTSTTGPTNYLLLNDTVASSASATAAWNGTAPTSTVFSLGNGAGPNSATTYVAYCFAEIAGYSKFGSYTGNGSTDGPFVYCGFRPKYVLIKDSTSAANWILWDVARDTYNVVGTNLYPNSSAADTASGGALDFTANGFKMRTAGAGYNTNSNIHIFAAFAEYPFGGSNVAPSPAR
jgi:hypothetical protein